MFLRFGVRKLYPRKLATPLFWQLRWASYKGVNYTPLLMPKLSPTGDSGNLGKWLVKEGDSIDVGDSYCEVITDKATVTFDAVDEGFIAKILEAPQTQNVPNNKIIGVQVDDESDVAHFKNFTVSDYSEDGDNKEDVTEEKETQIKDDIKKDEKPIQSQDKNVCDTTQDQKGERILASPLAKKFASEQGIDLNMIKGTGYQQSIIKSDLKIDKSQSFVDVSPQMAKESVSGQYLDKPHTNMRKTIASRLTESKQTIPHYYLTVDCNADKLIALRKQLNEMNGVKISVNDFIIKASAKALKKVKAMNSSWMDNHIREYNYVDICVAVSTETGLITPIVKDADLKGLSEISTEVKSLATRAREGKLYPHEYAGGTFTVSNLGMMGIKDFTAIINPPQAGILAIGTTRKILVPNQEIEGDKDYQTANVFSVTLSCDHRVVDGAKGAEWLKVFKEYIDNPMTMLL